MLKLLLFIFGWLCFALGVIGAFLPILPTTPFLLLAGVCFSKSSPRFHAWLLTLPVLGQGVRDWRERRAIRPRAKLLCSAMITLSLSLMWTSEKAPLPVVICVTALLAGVWMFVLTRRSA